MRRFYRPFARPGTICFDVGANRGDYSAVFLTLGARVIAVEPEARLARQMEARFAGRPIHIVRAAVSRDRGPIDFFPGLPSDVSTVSSAFMNAYGGAPVGWEAPVRVPAITLDEMVSEWGTPSFCKIDVEGWESQVLAGLSAPIPALSFESNVLLRDDTNAGLDELSRIGSYVFNFSPYESFRLALPVWVDGRALGRWLSTEGRSLKHGDVVARLAVEPTG